MVLYLFWIFWLCLRWALMIRELLVVLVFVVLFGYDFNSVGWFAVVFVCVFYCVVIIACSVVLLFVWLYV